MIRFGMVAAALALMASPLLAQESTEDLKKELEQLRKEVDSLKAVNTTKEVPAMGKIDADAMAADENPIMTLFKGVKLSGFVDTAYEVSFNQLHSTVNNGSNPTRTFDDRDNSFYLHNAQIQLERLATKDMIVGFHVELHAGHDSQVLNAGQTLDLQEAWFQILAPLGNGLDIRAGRQATLIGYEVVENTNNLNYSRGVVWKAIEPITATGVRAAYSFVDQLSATIGFANGPNFALDQFADTNHGKMVEAQVMIKPIKDFWVAVNMNVGGGEFLPPNVADKYYIFNIVGEYSLDKLKVALNFDQASSQTPAGRAPVRGLAAYAKYQLTDVYAPGVRVEYIGTGVPGNSRFITFTLTNEFTVAKNLIVRIEFRADNSNHEDFTRGANTAKGDYTLGFEALLPF